MPKRVVEACTTGYILELFQGMTYKRTFEYKNSNSTPIDLTGKSIVINFKNVFPTLLSLDSAGAPSALGSSVTITDAVNGKFQLHLTDEETATATLGEEGRWWIELHDGGDIVPLWRDGVSVEEI